MKLTFDTGRFQVLAFAIIYVAALEWAYPNVVSPLFAYQGMTYKDLPLTVIAYQWILALLPAFILPIRVTRPSHYQWWILYTTVVVPTALVSYHVINYEGTLLWLYLAVSTACFMLMIPTSSLPLFKLPRLQMSALSFWLVVAFVTVATYAGLIATLGIPHALPSSEEVYQLRSETKPLLENSLPVVFRYLFFWQGLVINPFILVTGLARRNPAVIVAGIGLQLLMFALTTLRVFFLNNLLVVGMYVLVVMARRPLGITLIKAFAALVLVSIGWWWFDNTALGPRVLLNRWVLMGGQISAYYYDYYADNPPDYLDHTILGVFFESPYSLPPNKTIGSTYFEQDTNAPGAIWADGFSNLGWSGIVLASLAGVAILWVLDSAFAARDPRFTVLLTVISANSFASQGVLSSILTGGILPVVILGLTSPNLPFARNRRTPNSNALGARQGLARMEG